MEPTYRIIDRVKDGKPQIVMAADLPDEIRPRLPYLALVELRYRAQPNGLPDKGELPKVTDREEQLLRHLKTQGVVHLGHITYDGVFLVAFHAPQALPAEITLKRGLLDKFKFSVTSRHDPDWSWVKAEMTLTPEEWEAAKSRQIHEVLAQHGDDPSKPRQVDFTFYFRAEEMREKFIAAVEGFGYSVNERGLWTLKSGEEVYGCEMGATTTIEPSAMASRCVFVRKQATDHEGVFDGWACPVTK